MTPEELKTKLFNNADRIAKARAARVKVLDYEDLRSDLLEHAMNIINKGDIDYDNKPENYINRAMSNKATTLTQRVFTDKKRIPITVSGEVEIEPITSETAETLLLAKEEKKAMYVTVEKIKFLCDRFGVSYDEDEPLQALKELCDLTLNRMDDEAFKSQPPEIQEMVAELGDSMVEKNLRIVLKSISKKRSSYYVSIKDIIREAMSMGIVESKGVYDYLDSKGITYNRNSVRIMACNVRQEMNIHKKKQNVFAMVKEMFDKNPHVSIDSVTDALTRKRVDFLPVTVCVYLTKLRKGQHNAN